VAQQGVARLGAAWTGGAGWVREERQGFPGARASGRSVGESPVGVSFRWRCLTFSIVHERQFDYAS